MGWALPVSSSLQLLAFAEGEMEALLSWNAWLVAESAAAVGESSVGRVVDVAAAAQIGIVAFEPVMLVESSYLKPARLLSTLCCPGSDGKASVEASVLVLLPSGYHRTHLMSPLEVGWQPLQLEAS